MTWEVTPHLRVSSSAVVVRDDEPARDVRLQVSSADKPFRIIGVEGDGRRTE